MTPGLPALRRDAGPFRREGGELAGRDAKEAHFEFSETPYYLGSAVAALAADPNVSPEGWAKLRHLASLQGVWLQGPGRHQPDWGRHYEEAFGKGVGRLGVAAP